MKKFFLIILFLPFLIRANAQSITGTPEWGKLIDALEKENWQDAGKLSSMLLKKMPDSAPDDPVASVLRYMYIHSEAGLMNMNKLTKEEAIKHVAQFRGKFIVLPGHPVSTKEGFNTIQMVNGKTDSLFITATNNDGTSIFSFEYIVLKEKWPSDDFKNSEGKTYKVAGIIKSITVEGMAFPRFKIIVEQGLYQPFD